MIEGMNHVLEAVPADPAAQRASYSDPTLPVVAEPIERVGRFIAAARPSWVPSAPGYA